MAPARRNQTGTVPDTRTSRASATHGSTIDTAAEDAISRSPSSRFVVLIALDTMCTLSAQMGDLMGSGAMGDAAMRTAIQMPNALKENRSQMSHPLGPHDAWVHTDAWRRSDVQ